MKCLLSMLLGVILVAPSVAATVEDLTIRKCLDTKTAAIIDCKDNAEGDLVIPSTIDDFTITQIGGYAFYQCKKLTSVKIPKSVKEIRWHAFSDCTNLKTIELPEHLAFIGDHAFAHCKKLTSIKIPRGITSIGWHLFDGCESLTSVEMSSDITTIGYRAFHSCKSLNTITIPKNVDSIQVEAFANCTHLKSIMFEGLPPTVEEGETLPTFPKIKARYNRQYKSEWKNVLAPRTRLWHGLKL